MLPQYGKFQPTRGWDRSGSLGHHANFNGFHVLAALLHGSQVVATITLGIGPHSSFFKIFFLNTDLSTFLGRFLRHFATRRGVSLHISSPISSVWMFICAPEKFDVRKPPIYADLWTQNRHFERRHSLFRGKSGTYNNSVNLWLGEDGCCLGVWGGTGKFGNDITSAAWQLAMTRCLILGAGFRGQTIQWRHTQIEGLRDVAMATNFGTKSAITGFRKGKERSLFI